eukprot:6955840-Prymnesium_polylepis.1
MCVCHAPWRLTCVSARAPVTCKLATCATREERRTARCVQLLGDALRNARPASSARGARRVGERQPLPLAAVALWGDGRAEGRAGDLPEERATAKDGQGQGEADCGPEGD